MFSGSATSGAASSALSDPRLLIHKGPSTKDVRQMGMVLKFRTFPDGGRGWFVKVRTSENFSEQLLNLFINIKLNYCELI